MKDNELGFQNFPTYTTRSTSRSRSLFVLIIVVILSAAILGGLYLLGWSQNKSKIVVPVPTAAATPLPTSSSMSAALSGGLTGTLSVTGGISIVDKATKLDRSKLGITVLNGSGLAGAAREVSDYLVSLGYKIVQVENANAFTYTNLNIIVKKSHRRYADLLRKDLLANPDFVSVAASISDDISSDAEVIVGQ